MILLQKMAPPEYPPKWSAPRTLSPGPRGPREPGCTGTLTFIQASRSNQLLAGGPADSENSAGEGQTNRSGPGLLSPPACTTSDVPSPVNCPTCWGKVLWVGSWYCGGGRVRWR